MALLTIPGKVLNLILLSKYLGKKKKVISLLVTNSMDLDLRGTIDAILIARQLMQRKRDKLSLPFSRF